MTVACQCGCRSVDGVWWHVRLLYVLVCVLVVVYSCSVTWILTATSVTQDCGVQGPSAAGDQSTDVVDPGAVRGGGIGQRVRRSGRPSHRRRSSAPAFYRDSSAASHGRTVDAEEWVWMSTYSKIPVSSTPWSVIVNSRFIARFSQIVSAKQFLKSVNIWRRYGHKLLATFYLLCTDHISVGLCIIQKHKLGAGSLSRCWTAVKIVSRHCSICLSISTPRVD